MIKHKRVSVSHPLRQAGVGVAVGGLHLLLVLAWWTVRPDMRPPRKDVDVAPVTVWLRGLPTLSAEPVKLERPQRVSRPGRSVRRHRDDPERNSSASVGSLTTDGASAMPSSEIASATQPKQLGSTLNLALSREELKSLAALGLAARTPFQGRLPITVERQIAEVAAQTGPWTEERIDADHIRLRRGTTCVMLSRPEIAKIDPFSDSARRMPWAATVFQCR